MKQLWTGEEREEVIYVAKVPSERVWFEEWISDLAFSNSYSLRVVVILIFSVD